MIRILTVEDDENIAKSIKAILSTVNYYCDICYDGNAAVDVILKGNYDLILLDVMLPGKDGFEIIEEIRGREVPVIFLTAKSDVNDKVRGLRSGADDYIAKPFEAIELLARVEAVLRRAHKNENVLKFRNIVADLDGRQVTLDGKPVTLNPREFSLLVFFMQNVNMAISREQLLSAVWGYSYMGENRTVDVHINLLRKKLGLHGALVTIPKVGYRLESR